MKKQTDRGWVDLSNLVYFKSGSREMVDWSSSVGKTVDFQYDDVISTLTITGRTDDIQYVYIDIPGYAQHRKIYVGQIRNGQLGSAVRKITADFKYEIGDVVDGLLITNRYKQPGYKYYEYCCTIDGYNGTIREDHLASGHGCPICHNSVGEKQIKKYLTRHNINFIQQHTFDDCKNIRALPFDFYLPDYNVCIEYDGMQHFEPVDFGGNGQEWARKQLESLKMRDGIKNDYCVSNNILLCRIKYTQKVQTTLDLFFNNLNNTQQND